MSFRRFIYYCAVWGAAAAYFGWVGGRLIGTDAPLAGAALKGLALGVALALGLGILDALAAGSRDVVGLGIRLTLAVLIGAAGGLVGGFLGQALYLLSGGRWSALLIFGWTLTGLLVGAAPSAFDLLGAVLRNEDRRGARRKVRNGLIGGAVGGLAGGVVSVLLHGLWASWFTDPDAQDLWSPSATGFVALGACIGLAVALAQIILREAWLRVEAGFRPGRQVLLTRPEIKIGRAESCDVGLFGDAAVEKVHAQITRQGDQWVLSDAGTAAGTVLNGQRLTTPTPLRKGDRIQVGGSVLSFDVRARDSAPAPAASPAG
jgi:MFS family permease